MYVGRTRDILKALIFRVVPYISVMLVIFIHFQGSPNTLQTLNRLCFLLSSWMDLVSFCALGRKEEEFEVAWLGGVALDPEPSSCGKAI